MSTTSTTVTDVVIDSLKKVFPLPFDFSVPVLNDYNMLDVLFEDYTKFTLTLRKVNGASGADISEEHAINRFGILLPENFVLEVPEIIASKIGEMVLKYCSEQGMHPGFGFPSLIQQRVKSVMHCHARTPQMPRRFANVSFTLPLAEEYTIDGHIDMTSGTAVVTLKIFDPSDALLDTFIRVGYLSLVKGFIAASPQLKDLMVSCDSSDGDYSFKNITAVSSLHVLHAMISDMTDQCERRVVKEIPRVKDEPIPLFYGKVSFSEMFHREIKVFLDDEDVNHVHKHFDYEALNPGKYTIACYKHHERFVSSQKSTLKYQADIKARDHRYDTKHRSGVDFTDPKAIAAAKKIGDEEAAAIIAESKEKIAQIQKEFKDKFKNIKVVKGEPVYQPLKKKTGDGGAITKK